MDFIKLLADDWRYSSLGATATVSKAKTYPSQPAFLGRETNSPDFVTTHICLHLSASAAHAQDR